MSFAAAEAIVRAVLYEGYMLYPYRPTSLKNRQRWSFGGLYPFGDGQGASSMQVQCLVGGPEAKVEIRARFLHLADKGGHEEATEREVCAPEVPMGALGTPHTTTFVFDSSVRKDVRQAPVQGVLEIRSEVAGEVRRLTVRVDNTSARGEAGGQSGRNLNVLASMHILIRVTDGELFSATDPPAHLGREAAACKQDGCWPVLVGEEGSRTLMLASPIILYDYPKVAPESPGDLFDSTEIDEILTLRILTLTEEEKMLARASDPRVRALIDRVEALPPGEWNRLHGALRQPAHRPARGSFKPGDRVRIAPKSRADIFDIALAGRSATVASIETDFEDTVYVTVTVDDDPGRDLGLTGQPGHRFFFRLDEVEAL